MAIEDKIAAETAPECYSIGEWMFFARDFRLVRGADTVKLEPKVAQLLYFLATQAGATVSRKMLMEKIWPGMVVGDEALTNAVNKLRKAFGDNRQMPEVIETIPKAGYRLIAQVKVVSASDQPLDEASSKTIREPDSHLFRRHTVVIASAILVLVIMALWSIQITKESNTFNEQLPQAVVSEKPSIAVMPFDTLGGKPGQEYFADGITDDIITELAKNPKLLVISRDSTFFYKGKPLDIPMLAQRLSVRYLLRGTVQRMDDSVRINAQLIDTRNEGLIWAERYDGSLKDMFAFQDQITRQIAASLSAKVETNTTISSSRQITHNSDAYDKFTFGRTRFYLYANKEENDAAREFFEAAVELDPNFAPAYAMLAWTHIFDVINGWVENREKVMAKSIALAEKAIALDDTQPIAYFVRGLAYREMRDYIKAMVDAEKAIEIDPNYANGYMLLSSLYYFAGRPEEGLELIRKSMRLHPHHPYNYSLHLGQVYFVMKQYDEAIKALEQAVSSHPSSERLHVWLAAAYAYAGMIDEAGWEIDQVQMINPAFSLDNIRRSYPFKDDVDREHFIEGLRIAGLDE